MAKKISELQNKMSFKDDLKYKQKELRFSSKLLWEVFQQNYEFLEGVKYAQDEISMSNIRPVLCYFSRSQCFFDGKNSNVVTNILNRELELSFDKGLLIIGGNGTGKTSSFKALNASLKDCDRAFRFADINDVVTEFNLLTNAKEHKEFNQKYMSRVATSYSKTKFLRTPFLFDEIKNEKEAKKFGTVNLVQDLIMTRANKNCLTHIICNYAKGSRSVEDALVEYATKYNEATLDRIFSNYNIIEFKGKSHRK